jgi:hypothetical protein
VTYDENGQQVIKEKVVVKEVIVEKNNHDLVGLEDRMAKENDR